VELKASRDTDNDESNPVLAVHLVTSLYRLSCLALNIVQPVTV
jgi:hypothetical protein